MKNGDIKLCPACGAIYIYDDDMYHLPWLCPECGQDLRIPYKHVVTGGEGGGNRYER